MSARVAAALAALFCGCTSQHDGPPDLPRASQVAKPSEAPVPAPTTPTPAFAPAKEGACTPDFRLREGICVHGAYAPASAQAFAQALSDYKRGAVPPMLGPRPNVAVEPRVKAPLGPGSLRKQSPNATGMDGGTSPKDRRLAELDTMIAAAREQLRQRDEASKAKRVEEPGKKQTVGVPTGSDAPPSLAATGTAPSANAAGAGEDMLQARLNELSQLTNGMSAEQLKELTSQLGGMGMDPSKLDSVLKQAGAGPEYIQR